MKNIICLKMRHSPTLIYVPLQVKNSWQKSSRSYGTLLLQLNFSSQNLSELLFWTECTAERPIVPSDRTLAQFIPQNKSQLSKGVQLYDCVLLCAQKGGDLEGSKLKKTQCQLCKSLTWPIIPLSWSGPFCKRVSPTDVITRGHFPVFWPFSAWWQPTNQTTMWA